MNELFKYISAHPLAGVAIILLLVLTVFVWIKAIQSGKKRNEEREKIIASIEKEKKLREDYRILSLDNINNEQDKFRVVQGVCANIQMSIEKLPDINSEFLKLNEAKRYIYCLGYVLEESKNSLSKFLRANGEPLLSVSEEAVRKVISGEFSTLYSKEFSMLDDNNETISVDEAVLRELNEKYRLYFDEHIDEICTKCVDYIVDNFDDLN